MQKNTTSRLETLNWDDLRYFLEVARTQRASAAAKRLGVDHTTVARRVRELETALGTVLFDKSRSGGFVLTAEGQKLLAYADAVETTCNRRANNSRWVRGRFPGTCAWVRLKASAVFFLRRNSRASRASTRTCQSICCRCRTS